MIAMHRHADPDANFLVTAPTYKILRQSTLPHFLRLMHGRGVYNVQDATFKKYGGGTCYFRSGHEPDSVVGIPNVKHVWGDEAGKYSLYFWENIQGRASPQNASIDITTSPYSLNWVYKELVKPTLRGLRDDVMLVQATSRENPYFSAEAYDAKEKTMDPRRFRQMYGGEWTKMSGLVYDCFSEEENVVDAFPLPEGTVVVGSIDWGFTDPFVLLLRAITPDGKQYIVNEFYRTGQTINDIVRLCRAQAETWGVIRFYCGPDQPASIEELCRAGLSAVPADNSIEKGVDCTYEMIRSRRLLFFRGRTPHLIDELDSYHYPEPMDLKPDQNAKPTLPVGQHDHAMDSLRYGTIMTYRGAKMHQPKYPDPAKKEAKTLSDHFQSRRKLKKSHLEDWAS